METSSPILHLAKRKGMLALSLSPHSLISGEFGRRNSVNTLLLDLTVSKNDVACACLGK